MPAPKIVSTVTSNAADGMSAHGTVTEMLALIFIEILWLGRGQV
jgi:hypothetical protein